LSTLFTDTDRVGLVCLDIFLIESATGRESLRDRNRASGGREASPGIFRFIEFIEFVESRIG